MNFVDQEARKDTLRIKFKLTSPTRAYRIRLMPSSCSHLLPCSLHSNHIEFLSALWTGLNTFPCDAFSAQNILSKNFHDYLFLIEVFADSTSPCFPRHSYLKWLSPNSYQYVKWTRLWPQNCISSNSYYVHICKWHMNKDGHWIITS